MYKIKNFKNNNEEIINHNSNLIFEDLISDSFVRFSFDKTFCVFKSINNIFYIIYSKKNNSIISYNMITKQKINEIKDAHKNYISSIINFFDKNNKRDLIMSISAEDNNIKIWNVCNFNCLISIENINKAGLILSSCFLNDNNQIYIITSNRHFGKNIENIKVYDLKRNKIKEIKDSNHNTFFIDIYYDKKLSKNFIITGNDSYSISYEYHKNKVYKKYCGQGKFFNRSLIVSDKEEIIKLIESNDEGFIIIWNFHSGEFLKKINLCNNYLCGICLLDRYYLFVGCYNRKIIILDLFNDKIINRLDGHEHSVITIKKIIHPKYGECFLSQGLSNDKIKLLVFKSRIINN